MIVMGIETSCDETSVAILDDNRVLANNISSQTIHSKFGGVVPELASRNHLRLIDLMVSETLIEANKNMKEIDAFAVTYGPGLVGALLVGMNYVKGLSTATGKPFVGVNHIEGHIFANLIEFPDLNPPFLALVVSGGHTQLVIVKKQFQYKIIGQTRDDAVGEAFDKVAKILGLGYPGGPLIDENAKKGDDSFIQLPRASFKNEEGFEFSYSGLKTAVLNYTKKHVIEDEQHLNNICASFQKAAISVLVSNSIKAARKFSMDKIVIAGGVSANSLLRSWLKSEANKFGIQVYAPPLKLCMDNAAMITRVGLEKLKNGIKSPLSLKAYPYLPIDQDFAS